VEEVVAYLKEMILALLAFDNNTIEPVVLIVGELNRIQNATENPSIVLVKDGTVTYCDEPSNTILPLPVL
jgi:hypothetical protein